MTDHVSDHELAPRRVLDTNKNFLMLCIRMFRDEEVKRRFNFYQTPMYKELYVWMETATNEKVVSVMDAVREKCKTRRKAEFTSLFGSTHSAVLRELGTEQLRQIVRLAAAVAHFSEQDRRFGDLFQVQMEKRRLPLTWMNGGSFLQAGVETMRGLKKKEMKNAEPLITRSPTPFEGLLFLHAVAIVDGMLKKKELTVKRIGKNGSRIGAVVSTLIAAFDMLYKHIGAGNCSTEFEPYIILDTEADTFKVIKERASGFAHVRSKTDILRWRQPVHTEQYAEGKAWRRQQCVDNAMRTIVFLFFDTLHRLIGNNQCYEAPILSKWEAMQMLMLPRRSGNALPMIFHRIPDELAAILHITRPIDRSNEVVTLGDGGEVESSYFRTPVDRSGKTLLPDTYLGRFNPTTVAFVDEVEVAETEDHGKRGMMEATVQNQQRKRRRLQMQEGEDEEAIEGTGSSAARSIVKEEDTLVMDATVPAATAHLSPGGKDAYRKLQEAMSGYCNIYDCNFQELEDTYEEQTGEELEDAVHFVLTDPPYNVRRERNDENSEHDMLSNTDMEQAAQLMGRSLKEGCHGHVFCAALQVNKWHETLTRVKKHVEVELDGGTEEQEKDVFEVESAPLIYARAPGNYNKDPRVRRITHMNVLEMAIHFWKEGPSHEELLHRVDYNFSGAVNSLHPAWTNLTTNIPKLEPEEVVYKNMDGHPGRAGRRPMLRPEQKNMIWMKALIGKFTGPGDLVMDMFAGTYATAKACLMTDKHRKFVGCDSDQECTDTGRVALVHIFASQLLNEKSDITGNEETMASAKLYVEEMKAIAIKKRNDAWKVPRGLASTQTFPSYILHWLTVAREARSFIGGTAQHMGERERQKTEGTLLGRNRFIPLNYWKEDWRNFLFETHPTQLFAKECVNLGLTVKDSRIAHPDAGKGLFAMRNFGRGEVIGHYYGSLVYSDLTRQPRSMKTYGEGYMAVTMEVFSSWAMQIKDDVKDKDGHVHQVWVVPAPFCTMRYINDARYLPGDRASDEEKSERPRKPNVLFEQNDVGSSATELYKHTLLKVKATRNISANEELYANYGASYQF